MSASASPTSATTSWPPSASSRARPSRKSTFAHVYTFQTATLLIEWGDGSTEAFGRDGGGMLSYLAVTTALYAAGFGLVTLGGWLRDRRASRRGAVDLDRARA